MKREDANIKDLDKDVKNKFKWKWLQEKLEDVDIIQIVSAN